MAFVSWISFLVAFVISAGHLADGWNLPNTHFQQGGGFDSATGGFRGEDQQQRQVLAYPWHGGSSPGGSQSAGGVAGSSGFAEGRSVGSGGVGSLPSSLAASHNGFQHQSGFNGGAGLNHAYDGGGVNQGANSQGFGAGNVQSNTQPGNGAPSAGHGAWGGYHNHNGAWGGYGGAVRPGYFGSPFVAAPHHWKYGHTSGLGGHGGHGYPWSGPGYVYRVPVAHVNPDGSYSFPYNTPHASRDETGGNSGAVAGTHSLPSGGVKHNGPDVDLRTNVGQSEGSGVAGNLNPADYGPQSIYSRGRLPFVPNASFGAGESQGPSDGAGTASGSPDRGLSWANRNGADGAAMSSLADSDQSALSVVGLPTTLPTDTTDSLEGSRDQLVSRSTEPSNDVNQPVNRVNDGTVGFAGSALQVNSLNRPGWDSYNNVAGSDGAFGANGGLSTNQASAPSFTTPRSSEASLDPVVTRPVSDPSYNFGPQDPRGSGSPSFNDGAGWGGVQSGGGIGPLQQGAVNAADGLQGRNNEGNTQRNGGDNAYFQPSFGAGNFRPAGGSALNPGGGTFGLGANNLGPAGNDRAYRFGYRTPDSVREESADAGGNVRGSYAYNNAAGRHDLQYVAGSGTGFRATGGSLSVPNGLSGTGGNQQFASGEGRKFGFNGQGGFTANRQPSAFAGQAGGQGGNFGATHQTVTRSPQTVPSSVYPQSGSDQRVAANSDDNSFSGSGDGQSIEGSGLDTTVGSGDYVGQSTGRAFPAEANGSRTGERYF
ncbi:uncharacterized PE-PGRS family protein PE_PGRS54-like [Anopheles bellator]|uniref:uncharacterized PE-PGRS family protein PE_PGRS54-like n=1 Tax=Anopheles bellator TaxID=139047 RepID=UPI002647C85B|nr:uncharacterized PE-PGRS family protein PE_PGRS54-like [Anopheles bellator]